MGDYFLDFRDDRSGFDAAEFLKFFEDMEVDRVSSDDFALTLTRTGSKRLWAPYEAPDGTLVALAGQVALDAEQWDHASRVSGEGGLACKAIYREIQRHGVEQLREINGTYAIHVFRPDEKRYFLFTDPAGCYPGYRSDQSDGTVFSSHPDCVADALGEAFNWDMLSLAEFVAAGQVLTPNTYYRRVAGLEWGTCYEIDLAPTRSTLVSARRIVDDTFTFDPGESVNDRAELLVSALSRCVTQSTNPILGETMVALSGGLDSRLIVSVGDIHQSMQAFCSVGRINDEYRRASEVADEVGLKLTPMQRPADHYGDSAEMGVRISGGMGNLFTNHFLGFREQLRALGCDNLLAGDYFDYLFKTLALDSRESRILRKETLAPFNPSCYLPHVSVNDRFTEDLNARMIEKFGQTRITRFNEDDRLEIAVRRTFPLTRAGTDTHREVSHRVFGFSVPSAYKSILDVYWRTPIDDRLNKKLIKEALKIAATPSMLRIPDNNSGRPVTASQLAVTVMRYRIALRRAAERRSDRLDTNASWLNWGYYVRSSSKIRELWRRPDQGARALVEEITGHEFDEDVDRYARVSFHYFLRLLTLKLWAEQRGASAR